MPKVTHGTRESFDRMNAAVRDVEGGRQDKTAKRRRPAPGSGIFEGILKADLERNGEVAFRIADNAGNEIGDTDETVRDVNKIPTGTTIRNGANITVYRSGDVHILISFDCDEAV